MVLRDDTHVVTSTIVGAKNVKRLCAAYAGPTSGFEIVHGLVDRVMTLLEVAPEENYVYDSVKGNEEKYRVSKEGWYYNIRELKEGDGNDEFGTYFPGRAAEILVMIPGEEGWRSVGTFGILHPEVLANFDVKYPASCLEMDLDLFV